MSTDPRPALTAEDILFVTREYGLRAPVEHREFAKGSARVAKSRLRASGRDWMLKRRPAAEAPRLGPVHAFQLHLAHRACPVARPMPNLRGETVTVGPLGAFELFPWVEGSRWSGRLEEAAEVGAAVGDMLRAAAGFAAPAPKVPAARRPEAALSLAPAQLAAAALRDDPAVDAAAAEEVARRVIHRATAARALAGRAGIAAAPVSHIHGDIHAGNVRFHEGRLAAVVDFDECRPGLRAWDIAMAALHFGMVGSPAEDPPAGGEELRPGHVISVTMAAANGMDSPLLPEEVRALPWLMIECCACEALSTIARTGRFGAVPALQMLRFVDRKTDWIESNADRLRLP
jgi:Ser/Thr protein kinase RdoA (MazF antagonist)